MNQPVPLKALNLATPLRRILLLNLFSCKTCKPGTLNRLPAHHLLVIAAKFLILLQTSISQSKKITNEKN